MKYKKLTQIIILVGIILSIPFINIIFEVKADILSQNPTSNSGLWILGSNAYSSDNNYAICSKDEDTHDYYNYDFDDNIPSCSEINSVEIGLEHYESSTPQGIQVRLTWNNEVTWSNWATCSSTTEVLDWLNATEVTEWTYNKLLNSNFKVQVKYLSSAGGCFDSGTMITLPNGEHEPIKDFKKGDKIMAYDKKQQSVLNVTEYKNHVETEFHVITTEDNRTLIVYESHRIVISRFLETKLVKDLALNDVVLTENDELVRITSISKVNLTNFHNIVVSRSLLFTEGILIHNLIKEPFTVYLDWIPVRVEYSVIEEEIDCNWIGINSTLVSNPTLFSADFTDLNETYGLSHNLISTNNSGIWLNSSWSNTWYNQNWTKWTLILNDTAGLIIAFRFYVNDSSGSEHKSTICFFPTIEITDYSIIFLVIGLSIGVCLMVVGVKIK